MSHPGPSLDLPMVVLSVYCTAELVLHTAISLSMSNSFLHSERYDRSTDSCVYFSEKLSHYDTQKINWHFKVIWTVNKL